ncbi:MAG: hypothetical protein U0835_16890 [Isosphaeraceae bacterium]
MLALASSSTATRRRRPPPESSWVVCRRNGRMNASASRASAVARSNSRRIWSSRLRRVSRGGVGERNIKELNGTSLFGVRRIRWKRIGPATASSPRA